MTDRKPPPKKPVVAPVEVIRRPAAAPTSGEGSAPKPIPTPTAAPTAAPPSPTGTQTPVPAARPAVPRPVPAPIPVERRVVVPGARPVPRPAPTGIAPRPAVPGAAPGAPASPRPFSSEGPRGAGGPPRFKRSGPPRPPPTEAQIQELAKRERVPARIAKGDLEGKMKARIWRKLHAEEAKRFDQAYALVDKHPGLDLADAFGMVQSGMTLEELRARREKTQKKQAVKEARTSVNAEAIDSFIQSLIDQKTELTFVLGERTLLDVMTAVEPIAFRLERSGRMEKLQVVMLARRSNWEKMLPRLDRDPKLTQKPAPIIRQPERRAVSDPRVFLGRVGKTLTLHLRNGIRVSEMLQAVGPFDLLMGPEGEEVFVPLHAILRWEDPAEVA